MIYLDAAATTKVAQEVYDEMVPYFMVHYGNPNGRYYELSEDAKKAIYQARSRISQLFRCNDNEITFNSGATEGNNTIVKGLYNYYKDYKILTTKIEHSSIHETILYLKSVGQDIEYIKVNEFGLIDIDDFITKLENVKFVCISWVNSELGTIQPIEEIAKICYNNNIALLVDATQAVGKLDINLSKYKGINFLTFSGHKINGPKGIGAVIKSKNKFGQYYDYVPLLHGDNEINPGRGGTLNVPGIVGLGKACELIKKHFSNYTTILEQKSKELYQIFDYMFKGKISLNTNIKCSISGILNLQIKGYNNELLLKTLSKYFAASTGSVCSNINPSRVLKEIGKSRAEISESIRISFDRFTEVSELKNILNLD